MLNLLRVAHILLDFYGEELCTFVSVRDYILIDFTIVVDFYCMKKQELCAFSRCVIRPIVHTAMKSPSVRCVCLVFPDEYA